MYALQTPESVTIGYPIAGIGSRFLAALIDSLVQTAIVVALLVLMLVVGGTSGLNTTLGYIALGLGIFAITAVLLGYHIFFELIWNGQTPGKRAMRIRVILTNGYPVTPLAVLIRNIVRLVDMLPAYYAIGVITMIVNRNSRRLGDLAAGTLVIKEGREGPLHALSGGMPASAQSPVPPANRNTPIGTVWPTAGPAPSTVAAPALTPEDAALIRDFLLRRWTLAPERRAQLAGQIATVIHSHIGGDPPHLPEPYLEQVLSAHENPGRT